MLYCTVPSTDQTLICLSQRCTVCRYAAISFKGFLQPSTLEFLHLSTNTALIVLTDQRHFKQVVHCQNIFQAKNPGMLREQAPLQLMDFTQMTINNKMGLTHWLKVQVRLKQRCFGGQCDGCSRHWTSHLAYILLLQRKYKSSYHCFWVNLSDRFEGFLKSSWIPDDGQMMAGWWSDDGQLMVRWPDYCQMMARW